MWVCARAFGDLENRKICKTTNYFNASESRNSPTRLSKGKLAGKFEENRTAKIDRTLAEKAFLSVVWQRFYN